MTVRTPIVAGQFYPASSRAAAAEVRDCLEIEIDRGELPNQIVAAIVPHAGWVCSGKVAGRAFKAISMVRDQVGTFVMFGAVHRYGVRNPAIFPVGSWQTPLGEIEIDEFLAGEILTGTDLIEENPDAHETEHSIEVQLPFIQELFPKAKIVPIMVPPNNIASQVGAAVGRVIGRCSADAVCIGSTDFTHYGPSYGFTPKGSGPEGLCWAKEVNDRRLLDRITQLDPEGVIECAASTHSACGAGAISATIGVAKQAGADIVKILEHTTSAEVLADKYGPNTGDSVGYAAIVFGREVGSS